MRPVCLCVLALSPMAVGATIYQQSPFATEGFSSTYDSSAVFAFLAADNFSLTSSTEIDQVRWWGNGDDFGLHDLANFTQFRVTIYSRLPSGLPGASVYSQDFATADTSPTNSGLVSFNGTTVWRQTATLPTPQVLGAGDYMLAIGPSAYVDDQGSIWYWNAATSGDGYLAYDAYDGNGWQQFTQQPIDLAFALLGQNVPVPGAGATLLLGGAALTGRRRR